jgi:protein-L-isoaspartate(D-aspartate) O-methyltransferase
MSTPNHKIRMVMELRRAGVVDTTVLAAIERVPREAFVPASLRDRAYENMALPLAHGQTVSQPVVVALMTQALALSPRMRVLEIGTGSGYQASILSALARRVYTIERHRPLLVEAETRFAEFKLRNIVTRCGDGWLGWPEAAPFERIIVTAAPDTVPQTLVDQLADGGVMVVPVGQDSRDQRLLRLTRRDGVIAQEDIAGVRFVPMVAGLPEETVRANAQG